MRISITEEERADLKRLHRKQGEPKEADRIKAILLLASGYSREEVARILLRDEGTITAWQNSFGGRENLASWLKDKNEGYQGRLNEQQMKELDAFVQEKLIQDARQVQAWILEQYGIQYTITGIHALLHKLDFQYKETTGYPSKMDPVDQADFNEFYEDLLENMPEGSILGFLDAVHPQHNTRPTKAWIKKGARKFLPSNTGRKRLNINGFYNPLTQEVICRDEETINAQATIELLKDVEKRYPTALSINIVCDNARYYYNEAVQDYLQNSRIELIYLPTYSPNLNLIERLWKFMRKESINAHYYEQFKDFKLAVLGFLENIHLYKDKLKQFIGLKLHLFNPLPA